MEKITITIFTGGAAFEDTPATELGRILRDLAECFEQDGIPPARLFDVNGNACGRVDVEGGR